MNKQKIRQISAFVLIGFIVLIFVLVIYFALIGNIGAALSALSFNAFFAVVVYFLIKLNRYVTTVDEEDEEEPKQ